MTYRQLTSGRGRAAALLMAAALLLATWLPTLAAVTLTMFEAAPQENTILVRWAAATELDTISYRLFRAESEQPGNWGTAIHVANAEGGVAPANYSFTDVNVTPGVTYYYLLEDISTSGTPTAHGPKSARIALPGEVPTNTPTPTPTRTWTPPSGSNPGASGPFLSPTPITPAPTATPRFTLTPVISPLNTPLPGAPTVPLIQRGSPTPLLAAQLTTPTRQAPLATSAPAAVQPTVEPVAQLPTPTATPQLVAAASAAGLTTATAVPTRDVTPIIFSAGETEASPTPTPAQGVAAQGSRNTGLALTVGGAALGLAGLAAAVLLFLRSRKV